VSNRITRVFEEARRRSRKVLVTYLMAGDPSPAASVDALEECVRGGADILEIGFPFSDPIADGPTIQKAASRALAAGVRLDTVLEVAREVRRRVDVPIVLMGYVNPVLSYGLERFVQACASAGVDGLILPDLPPEEATELLSLADRAGIAPIFLSAPTSTDRRLQAAAQASRGFTYFVSVTGVTGERRALPEVSEPLARLRAVSQVPVVVGFGVNGPEAAKHLARDADGVVVGSALVERHSRGEPIAPFVRSLSDAINR
jgi:tryptophan synthase alpha chain